eukprot:195553_1
MLVTAKQTEETGIESETVPLQIVTKPVASSLPTKPSIPQQQDHTKRDIFISKYLNIFYDTLTIFISIADVTTDIIVLISYYTANRMTFFWISFTILIIAQIVYLVAFLLSFDIEHFIDALTDIMSDLLKSFSDIISLLWCKCCDIYVVKCIDTCLNIISNCMDKLLQNKYIACIAYIFGILCVIIPLLLAGLSCCFAVVIAILIPVGHLVSFLMYFAENEESKFSKWLSDTIGIKKRTMIEMDDQLSDMAKFTIKKLNKHGGFMLEAFVEAAPQSILQLIAMVYFKETNLIAVGSIILSFTSIMTKSLVVSQGIEWKSFFFWWICICTDFFSIFFIVSWIFLSNDYIYGDFIGHFSLIGKVWFMKVVIAIVAPILFFAIGYFSVGMWLLTIVVWKEFHRDEYWFRILMVFLFLTLGNVAIITGYCIGACIVCLFLEIVCFGMIPVFIYLILTISRWDYTEKTIANVIKTLLTFISDGSYTNNDRIIRILCINYTHDESHHSTSKLSKYIIKKKKEEMLYNVSFKNIRDNCSGPEEANIFQTGFREYCKLWKYYKKEAIDDFDSNDCLDSITMVMVGFGALLLMYISLPIYLLSRVVTILYPYFIVFYLFYYDLWFKMHIFELSMLGMYILLQIVVFIMFYFVARTHLWLWH